MRRPAGIWLGTGQRGGGDPGLSQRHRARSSPMAPAPGTPLGGERPRQRASSPRSPRQGGGMAVDGGGSHPDRVFCPVPSCPCSDPARARGWRSVHNMHSHIDAHLAGTLSGDVPAEWMGQEGRQRCPVCSLSVSTRFGVHPTCRPEARAAAGPIPTTGRVDGLPTFADIQAGHTPTLRHVPQAARHSWSKALTRALATAAHFNTEASWRELLMLPQTVLAAPPRGGKKHKKAPVTDVFAMFFNISLMRPPTLQQASCSSPIKVTDSQIKSQLVNQLGEKGCAHTAFG